jgi:hypothetical protein
MSDAFSTSTPPVSSSVPSQLRTHTKILPDSPQHYSNTTSRVTCATKLSAP